MTHRFRVLALVALAVLLLPALVTADAGAARRFYFDIVEQALVRHGDPAGARLLKALGQASPTIPAELSDAATTRLPEYAAKYENARARVRAAIQTPAHLPVNQWRVDRAEADLHLVAHELEKANPSTALLQRWLWDAIYALDHTIFPEMINATPAAPRASITADPASITAGQSSLLRWNTMNATRALLDGEVVSLAGSRSVSPAATTVYRIVGEGPGGSANDAATVTVAAVPPPTATINANPARIMQGQSTTLSWNTQNATSAAIDGRTVSLAGTMPVTPDASRAYTITATGAGDGRASASTFVTVVPQAREPRKWIIFFDFDQALIRADAQDTMQSVADAMRAEPELRLNVVGHTDAKGGENYNLNLSERRAISVRDYFTANYGVSPTRLDLIGKGEEEPIAPNTTPVGTDNPEGRQMNRRAEFVEILR